MKSKIMICEWHTCNKQFTTNRDIQRFCSYNCKNKNNVQYRRIKVKKMAIEYKGGKCQICGYNRCIAAFDFHHLDRSQKDINISSGNTIAWTKLKIELDKCILLCANCHREKHWKLHQKHINASTTPI